MVTRKSALTVFLAFVIGSGLSAPVLGTANVLHTNRLTFSGPVRLPGVTLAGGTYIFERVVDTNPDVVVIRSEDRTRVFYMGSTQPVRRPESLAADRLVTFGEPRGGGPPPIAAWYPEGARLGHAFVYASR
jgi:hypothetical protein